MRKLDKYTARAAARVERAAPDSKDTAAFLRRARSASLKAMWSRFGALAEEEYDKIAPVIACTLPALTDSIPERKRGELAGEVTREQQVVGKAASIAIQTCHGCETTTKPRHGVTDRGAREEYRMDRAPVHGMEGEPRRTYRT